MSKIARHRPVTSRALILLAILFTAAGMSRLGLGVAEVIAAEPDTSGADLEDVAPPPPDPADLLASLRAREARLAQAEADLQERTDHLHAAELELERQIETLIATEARLAGTLRLTESAAEDDLHRLTTVFEHMKPAQAAELFSQMDTEFAAGFVARLRPDFAGEVMAGLDPVIAYAISAVLAGRHARTPRN